MSTETRSRSKLAAIIAPVEWVGRDRRRRRTAWAVGAVLVVCAGAWVWREGKLWGLPDVGDPFDVKAFGTVALPEDENAYVLYQEASRLLTRMPRAGIDRGKWWQGGWSEAAPQVRAWVDQNQEALDVWRRGTERPSALYHQPKDLTFDTLLPVDQGLRQLDLMAGLRGSSLEEQGDAAGAWTWYRAMLRCSQHLGMHGVFIERLIGRACHEDAAERVTRWAANPKTGVALLRRALDETIATEAMTPPPSEAFKTEYVMIMRELNRPGRMIHAVSQVRQGVPGRGPGWAKSAVGLWVMGEAERAVMSARSDPERSRRVLRRLFANWLAQCDRPPDRRARARPLGDRAMLFEPDPSTPPAARALSPEELAGWFESTTLAKAAVGASDPNCFVSGVIRKTDEERVERARLIVSLASQLFLRERGRPLRSPEELVGTYLEYLPVGYEPDAKAPQATEGERR
jgi:hypothetical protein